MQNLICSVALDIIVQVQANSELCMVIEEEGDLVIVRVAAYTLEVNLTLQVLQ